MKKILLLIIMFFIVNISYSSITITNTNSKSYYSPKENTIYMNMEDKHLYETFIHEYTHAQLFNIIYEGLECIKKAENDEELIDLMGDKILYVMCNYKDLLDLIKDDTSDVNYIGIRPLFTYNPYTQDIFFCLSKGKIKSLYGHSKYYIKNHHNIIQEFIADLNVLYNLNLYDDLEIVKQYYPIYYELGIEIVKILNS